MTTTKRAKDALLKTRTVLLEGEITEDSAHDVMTRLLFLESESREQPIQLLIDSPGGAVSAGLAIMDAMDQIHPPVATHCRRIAHSMAAVILTHGRNGFRSATPEAIITFSLPRPTNDAEPGQQTNAARFGDILVEKVSKSTGQPVDAVRGLFVAKTPLSAEQAVARRVVDRIGHSQPPSRTHP